MESSIGNKFIDGLMDRNATSVKLLSVIFSLLVNSSIIKLSTDLLTGKAHKKITYFIPSVFFSGMLSYN
jgi:hypothetical protein